MNDKCFVDTNILVYAYNADEKEKHAQAVALLRREIEGIRFVNPFKAKARR
jgi:predicted nucleic acid-binding protein